MRYLYFHCLQYPIRLRGDVAKLSAESRRAASAATEAEAALAVSTAALAAASADRDSAESRARMAVHRLQVVEAALAAQTQEQQRAGVDLAEDVGQLKAELERIDAERLKAEARVAELTEALDVSDRDRERLRLQLQRLKEQMINEQVRPLRRPHWRIKWCA